jgi:hypothetical protein
MPSVSFESGSQLARIESNAFWFLPLRSIVIPPSVRFIGAFAFCNEHLSSISISIENDRYVIDHNLLIDIVDHTSMDHFPNSPDLTIPSDVQTIGSESFSKCKQLSSVSFAFSSKLKQIESHAFSFSGTHSSVIPRPVPILGSSCFWPCERPSSVKCEFDSQLTRIGSSAFSGSLLKLIMIPRILRFLVPPAFPIVSQCH